MASSSNPATKGLNAPNATQQTGYVNGFRVTRYNTTNSGNNRNTSGGTNAGVTRTR